jgi:hypothetical protein
MVCSFGRFSKPAISFNGWQSFADERGGNMHGYLDDIAPEPDYAGEGAGYRRQSPESNADISGERTKPGAATPRGVRSSRIITTGLPWLTDMSVPFGAVPVLNEQVVGFTKAQDFDVVTLGAWSSLVSARARLSVTGYARDWSIEQVPVQTFAGNTDKVQPIRWTRQPSILPAQAVIRGDWINSGTEAAGRATWFCDRYRKMPRRLEVIESVAYFLQLDLSLAGLTAFTSPIDDPVLIWGAQTNAAAAARLIQLYDEKQSYQWSAEQLPVYAVAGFVTAVTPLVFYPRPYFLDKRSRLRGNFDAVTTNGYMTFVCERLLNFRWVDSTPGDPTPKPAPTPQAPGPGSGQQSDFDARRYHALKWKNLYNVWPEAMKQWKVSYPHEGWWDYLTGNPPANFFAGIVPQWKQKL